jgi:anti-anti-sigma regulatory factor
LQLQLAEIRSNYVGFQRLIELGELTKNLVFDELLLDMSKVTWCDANMSAPLGALLYRTGRRGNSVKLVNLNPSVKQILQKNGFLSN